MTLRAFVIQTVGRRCHCRSNRGAVFDQPYAYPLQVLQKPIMIQRHWAHDIRSTRKGNNADAIIWPGFDELACYFANSVHPRRLLSPDCKILREHRSGDVKHEHNIDPTCFHFGETFTKLRTRERYNEDSERRQQ